MVNTERQCIICGIKIGMCMGFALARDLVNRRVPVREICGKCGLVFLEMNETQLIKHINGKVAERLKAPAC